MTARNRRRAPARTPVLDPNVYERSVLYISAAELIDTRRAQRATAPSSSPEPRRRKETTK